MFEVIGERINTSRKLIQTAVADRDADYIVNDVKNSWKPGPILSMSMPGPALAMKRQT